MKLEELKKLSPPGGISGAGAAGGSFQSDVIFAGLGAALKEKPEVVKRVGGVYYFKINGEKTWTVDLKNGAGFVKEGEHGKADCTITIKDEDFVAMITGAANGQQLFMSGKLKIQGNMALGMGGEGREGREGSG